MELFVRRLKMATIWQFLALLGLFPIILADCPEQCTCDVDLEGRKRVRCFKGGLEGALPIAWMDENIKVLVVTAPRDNPNNLTIGRIFLRTKQLEEIHITHSFVPAIGDNTFWDTTQLRLLNLSSNNIGTLRENNFKGLEKLEGLHLDENSVTELPSAVFRWLPNLLNLTMSHNRLTKLVPRLFYGVDKLHHLDLSWNPIREIDAAVFEELKDLRRLYLSHCDLRKFESMLVRNMQNLEVLDLSHNHIDFVGPDEFKFLGHLKSLYLHSNRVNTILENTFFGHNLTVLTISRNNITNLMQEAFNNLTVKGLDLSYNRMKIADPDFLRPVAENLIKLDISGNHIRGDVLSELIDRFPVIRDLSISSLGLTELDPNDLQFPKTLRKLNVSNNYLLKFPAPLLQPLKMLEMLDLSNNKFRGLDHDMIEVIDDHLDHLHVLYLHDNPWSCDLCYIPALLAWLNESKHFEKACEVLHRPRCLKCSIPYNLSGQAIQFLNKDDLEPCEMNYTPVPKVAGPEPHLGIIIACAVIVLLLVTITIILVLYYRRGADYYTHEGERDDDGIYENPGVDEENGDLLDGRKPTIATIEDEFKDDSKYPQTKGIVG